jgi:hypothetical protein
MWEEAEWKMMILFFYISIEEELTKEPEELFIGAKK